METDTNQTLIQESTSSEAYYLLMMNTMGRSCLVEVLEKASLFITTTSGTTRREKDYYHDARRCFAFIQGTGLDVMLEYYHVEYDADKLRRGFNHIFRNG